MENNSLTHHGILGMKWGRRRYQNKDGSLTAAGKKRYGDNEPEETVDQKKARILKNPTAEDVYKNREIFSDKEIQNLYNRLNNERNIKGLIPEKERKGKKFIDKYVDTSKTIKDATNATEDLYNSIIKAQKLVDKIINGVSKT